MLEGTLARLKRASKEIRKEIKSPEYQRRVKEAKEANWYHENKGKRETIQSKPEGADGDTTHWPVQKIRPENHPFYDRESFRDERDLKYEEKRLAQLPREVAEFAKGDSGRKCQCLRKRKSSREPQVQRLPPEPLLTAEKLLEEYGISGSNASSKTVDPNGWGRPRSKGEPPQTKIVDGQLYGSMSTSTKCSTYPISGLSELIAPQSTTDAMSVETVVVPKYLSAIQPRDHPRQLVDRCDHHVKSYLRLI